MNDTSHNEQNPKVHLPSLPIQTLLKAARQRGIGDGSGCETILTLITTDRLIRHEFHKLFSSLGLSDMKFVTLVTLFALEPMKPMSADLAFHVEVSRSAMTDILDQLEGKGCILRHRHQEDRRVIQVQITDLGRDIVSKAIEQFLKTSERLTQGMDLSQRNGLLQLCAELAKRSEHSLSNPIIR